MEPGKLLTDAAALAIPGVGGALAKIPGVSALGGAVSSIPGIGAVESVLKGAAPAAAAAGGASAGAPAQGAGTNPGLLQSLEGFLTGNGGANALGIAQGVNAATLQQKSNDYAKNALGTVQQSYNDRAPLRAAGLAGMLHPQTPSLAPLQSVMQTGNPYAPKVAPAAPGGAS